MEYIKREIDKSLAAWKNAAQHKPLLLRGARRVGKSSSVRELGKQFEYFLEINFENNEYTEAKKVFEQSLSYKMIADALYTMFGISLEAGKTLLFLDEIQSCADAISALRFFYEEMPELHVIVADSFLEFDLEELPSYDVDRITLRFMYPLSFSEYLGALKMEHLSEAIKAASSENPLSEDLHHTALKHLINHIAIGGMPEVVAAYAQGGTLAECMLILDSLMRSYYDDFAKYQQKISPSLLRRTLKSIAKQTGNRFNYSEILREVRYETLKQSVEWLVFAGLAYPLNMTGGNGLPLGAEINQKFCRFLIFDTGVMLRILGENISDILLAEKFEQINKGNVVELFVGLELLKNAPPNLAGELYYWLRNIRNSHAQVDFLIQKNSKIVPIEVKSGTTGKMQSLNLFMKEKQSLYGIRTSLENFAEYNKIKVYPLYAIGILANYELRIAANP
ncbi:MAG: AAA family ATPase [Bacteroidales bacterium]|jgi:predicted AAA+ superfamily ATPase|nr:AAA family ATPase [Bacteroidales bacterium]